MSQRVVIIGPFRRRVFAEGLFNLLRSEPGLSVRMIADEAEAESYLAADTPTIVILESLDNAPPRTLLPKSDAVAVILIAQEGKDVQVALRHMDRNRLRMAIGLVAETPHPRVVALDSDASPRPFFAMPRHRIGRETGLSFALDWLDAVFGDALDAFAAARSGAEGLGWMQDLDVLRDTFSRSTRISGSDADKRLQAMMNASVWRDRLFDHIEIDPVEMKLICLAAAPDIDQRYRQAIGLMQGNYAEGRPNASTLAAFLGPDHVGADVVSLLSGRRPFARLGLLQADGEIAPQPGYRLAPTMLDLMLGIHRQSGLRWRLQEHALQGIEDLILQLRPVLESTLPLLVLVDGEEAGGTASEVAAALIAAGKPVLRTNGQGVPAESAAITLKDWALRARLHDAALLVEGLEGAPAELREAIFASEFQGLAPLTMIVGDGMASAVDAIHLRVPRPGLALRGARWQAAARDHGLQLSAAAVKRLGGTLKFSPEQTDAVARMASAGAVLNSPDMPAEGGDDLARILSAARQVAVANTPETVRRARCLFDWDDIVLPPGVMAAVRTVPEHVKHAAKVLDRWNFAARLPYGRGVGVLFSGPSGTGKTMCAQVIAADLGVELMQVEISRCVSKYIGETEKNIDRCFAAAEAASAALLFDEGDALFGKRTEIKDAHDRHANVEVAYLLQRIEAYEGLVILTSNLKSNIDAAFLRRLRFVIDFPMPTAEDRKRIWSLAFPSHEICAGDVDIAFLARRLPLSGGSIQSIAVNAAFGAASDGCEKIHMRHVMAATRAELVKNGMLSAEKALAEPAPHEHCPPTEEAVS